MEGWHCREKLREGAALVGSSHGESLHTTGEELQFQTVPAECSSKAGGFLHVSTGACVALDFSFSVGTLGHYQVSIHQSGETSYLHCS